MSGAYVRVTNSGDHHVACDLCGVLAWHVKSYRFALRVAALHRCKPRD